MSGEVDPATGMIINLRDLKAVIEHEVVSQVDHKNLNVDVEFMRGQIASTEVFAARIFERLDRALGPGLLSRVVLWESENNRIEIAR